MTGHNVIRARAVLHAILPDLPREDWVRVSMAVHAAGLSFDDCDAWSDGAVYRRFAKLCEVTP